MYRSVPRQENSIRSESSRFVDGGGILLQAREVEGELSMTFFHSDRGGSVTLALPHVISRSAHVHVSSKWTYGLARSSDFSIFRKPPLRNGQSTVRILRYSSFLSFLFSLHSSVAIFRNIEEISRAYIYIYMVLKGDAIDTGWWERIERGSE